VKVLCSAEGGIAASMTSVPFQVLDISTTARRIRALRPHRQTDEFAILNNDP